MLVGSIYVLLAVLGTATTALAKPTGPGIVALRRASIDTSTPSTSQTSTASTTSSTPQTAPQATQSATPIPMQWDNAIKSWALNISIGSQIFAVQPVFRSMDTLSVPSVYCVGVACLDKGRYLNMSAGETYNAQNGSFLGWDFQSDVSIGGSSSGPIMKNLTFHALSEVQPKLVGSALNISGILPLSACNMSTSNSSDHAVSLLNYPPFSNTTVQLLGVNFDYNGGTFCPGCVDTTAIDTSIDGNAIDWWPLRQDRPHRQDWQVRDMEIWLDGDVAATGIDVIISGDIDEIYAPRASVDKFYKSIPGAKPWPVNSEDLMYIYPCQSQPHMALQSLNATDRNSQWQVLLNNFNMGFIGNGTYCVGAVMSPADDSMLQFKPTNDSESIDVWLFGNRWLIEVYTIFDLTNQRFGVAHKKLS